ncbi:hypothetical protein ROHU_015939 [Labeo rohita]|uniref:Uncharacterized protein n=1 Tax=Labeo rohita TaxID=84645 RepID=A0A498NMD2_LABRO|nr:hypothetical protein ROHU_015939 [Labeo rohita]
MDPRGPEIEAPDDHRPAYRTPPAPSRSDPGGRSYGPPYFRAPTLRPGPRGLKAGSTDSPRRPLSDAATPESTPPPGGRDTDPRTLKGQTFDRP